MVVRADSQGAFLYHGGFLLAAIAAVLFVASATVDGPVASVLSIRPLAAIGVISYGLYLWHWPVDVVLDENRTGLTGYSLFAARIAVTGVIAIASYLIVERPIRRNGLARLGSWVRAPRRLRPAIVGVAAGAVAILLAVSTTGAVAAPSLASLANAHQLSQRHTDPRQARVLMVGDSQMFTLDYYGDSAFNAAGPRYSYAPIIGCGIFDPSVHLGGNCNERLPRWRQQIRLFNPDLSVLLIGAWEALDFTVNGHTYVHATPEHERELVHIFESTLRTLTARGTGRAAASPVYGGESGRQPDDDP